MICRIDVRRMRPYADLSGAGATEAGNISSQCEFDRINDAALSCAVRPRNAEASLAELQDKVADTAEFDDLYLLDSIISKARLI